MLRRDLVGNGVDEAHQHHGEEDQATDHVGEQELPTEQQPDDDANLDDEVRQGELERSECHSS